MLKEVVKGARKGKERQKGAKRGKKEQERAKRGKRGAKRARKGKTLDIAYRFASRKFCALGGHV